MQLPTIIQRHKSNWVFDQPRETNKSHNISTDNQEKEKKKEEDLNQGKPKRFNQRWINENTLALFQKTSC